MLNRFHNSNHIMTHGPLPQGGEGWNVNKGNRTCANWKLQTVGVSHGYSCSSTSGSRKSRSKTENHRAAQSTRKIKHFK